MAINSAFSFDTVQIQYNPGGKSPQTVQLDYDEIPNIALNLDRELYPKTHKYLSQLQTFSQIKILQMKILGHLGLIPIRYFIKHLITLEIIPQMEDLTS